MDTAAEPLRSHDIAKGCDHKFVDSVHCLKCGWTPPPTDLLGTMLVMWERMTYDEHPQFLKKVTIR